MLILQIRGPAAFNLKLVSEVEDPEYGTVVFPGADTNTERGHCQKTEAILNYFYKHAKENNWYVKLFYILEVSIIVKYFVIHFAINIFLSLISFICTIQ